VTGQPPSDPPPGQYPPPPQHGSQPQYPPPPPEWYADQQRRQLQAAHPHPEPRSYPLMLRTWNYAWWKPIVGLLVGVVIFFVVQIALTVFLVIGAAVDGGPGTLGDRVTRAENLDKVTPWTMLYVNLGLASLILVAMLVMRVVHGLRPRWLASVLPGVRWKFFFACIGLAAVALAASLVVGALLPEDPNSTSGTAHAPTGQLLATALVILFTTPLQAIGEEYGFRGYLMQAFGSFSGSRVVALLVTSVLFALAHGTQNFPLFFDRFAFGLMAGLVVILVGGLEAGIALHILNNLLAFGVAIAYNQLDSTLTVSSASWWQLPVTVVQNGVFLVLVLWVARRMGLRNTTEPPPRTGGDEQSAHDAVLPAG
jgi:membrane protease YdiL (CAAX protease family)